MHDISDDEKRLESLVQRICCPFFFCILRCLSTVALRIPNRCQLSEPTENT